MNNEQFILLVSFLPKYEDPPTQETPCNIGDEIVNGTLPASDQVRCL